MHFVQESRIAAPPGDVFAFHESPGALDRLNPPGQNVRVVQGGDSLQPGSRTVLRIGLGPLAIRWVAIHTEYDPPHLFADRQESGPFASWYHRHRFLDDGQGGTILRDEVDFEPPLGPLGRWLGGIWIGRKLRQLFDYRHETTRRLVEAHDFENPGPQPEESGPSG